MIKRYEKTTEEAFHIMIHEKDLNRTDIIIFQNMHLASVKDGNIKIYKHGKKFLAKKLKVSVYTIQKSLDKLKKCKLIRHRYRYKIIDNDGNDKSKIGYVHDWEKYNELRKKEGTIPIRAHHILEDIGVRGPHISK